MTNSTAQNPRRAVAIIDALIAPENLRVWSVIVTAFGDLAIRRDDQISGQCLSRLTQPMGLKPEAVRVALFRLKKDGWIESRKLGRQSLYRLSDRGYNETKSARDRIYGLGLSGAPTCRLCLAPPHNTLLPAGMARVNARVFLDKAAGCAPPDGWFCLDGAIRDVPGWLREELAPQGMGEALTILEASLNAALQLSDKRCDFSPVEIATFRILIVHQWRRVVLRLPDLPERFFPDDWPLDICRSLVETLLERFPRPPISDLIDV